MERRSAEQRRASKEAFDATRSSEVGLLCEMSVAELTARLGECKLREERVEKSKRHAILSGKQSKQAALLAKARNLSKIRAQRSLELKSEKSRKAQLQRQIEREGRDKAEDTVLLMARDLRASQQA